MVAEYIADEWHSRTETLWEGITRLEPAHRMTVSSAVPTQQRYWAPETLAELVYKRDEEYIEHYRSLLFDVVRRTSRSQAGSGDEILAAGLRARLKSRRVSHGRISRKEAKFSLLKEPFIQGAGEWTERELASTGLEVRHPYRLRGIVEFAFVVPERILSRGRTNRWLHRQILGGLLPEDVRQRQSKAEFSVAYERALAELESRFEREVPEALFGRVEVGRMEKVYSGAVLAADVETSPAGFQIWGAFGCALIVQARGGACGSSEDRQREMNVNVSV